MEDNQYPTVRKPSNKAFWWIIVAIVVIIATNVIVFVNHDSINKVVESKVAHQPEAELVCSDTVKAEKSVLTIQEILSFREDVKEGMRVDSIFLSMPEPILIDILITHGTSFSNSDIVYIYESNKSHYKSVKTGADIQKNFINSISKNDSVRNPRDSLKR